MKKGWGVHTWTSRRDRENTACHRKLDHVLQLANHACWLHAKCAARAQHAPSRPLSLIAQRVYYIQCIRNIHLSTCTVNIETGAGPNKDADSTHVACDWTVFLHGTGLGVWTAGLFNPDVHVDWTTLDVDSEILGMNLGHTLLFGGFGFHACEWRHFMH